MTDMGSIEAMALLEAGLFELSIYELDVSSQIQVLAAEELSDVPQEDIVGAVRELVSTLFIVNSNEIGGAIMRLLHRVYIDARFETKLGGPTKTSSVLAVAADETKKWCDNCKSDEEKLLLIQHYCAMLSVTFKRVGSASKASADAEWVISSLHSLGATMGSLQSLGAARKAAFMVARKLLGKKDASSVVSQAWLSSLSNNSSSNNKQNSEGMAFMLLVPHLSAAELGQHKPQLVAMYTEVVKSACPRAIALCKPFAALLQQEDWTNGDDATSVEGVVVAMMKKSVEGSAHAVTEVLSHLTPGSVDLSTFYSSTGMAIALRLLKAAKAESRLFGGKMLLCMVERCGGGKDSDAAAAAVGAAASALLEKGVTVKTESAPARGAMGHVLTELATRFPQAATATAVQGKITAAGLLELAKHLDKEGDRACAAQLGRALGAWMWVLRSAANDGGSSASALTGVEAGQFAISKVLQAKLLSSLGTDKGCLPVLVTLAVLSEERGSAGGSNCVGGAEDLLAAALKTARKASSNTLVEASLALTLLLRMPAQSGPLMDKTACWDSFSAPSSFLVTAPKSTVGGTASGQQASNNNNATATFAKGFPRDLRLSAWRLDGAQVCEAMAAAGRAFCLAYLVKRSAAAGKPLLLPLTESEDEDDDAVKDEAYCFKRVRDQFTSVNQLSAAGLRKDNESVAPVSASVAQAVVASLLHFSAEGRSFAADVSLLDILSSSSKQGGSSQGVARVLVDALRSHLEAHAPGTYPHNRAADALLALVSAVAGSLVEGEKTSPGLLVSIGATACHPYVCGSSQSRARALSKTALALLPALDDNSNTAALAAGQLLVRTVLRAALDTKECARWMAQTVCVVRPLGPSINADTTLLDRALAGIDGSGKVTAAQWTQLLEITCKVSSSGPSSDKPGASSAAPVAAPASIPVAAVASAPVSAAAPARRKKKVFDDDDDDDFASRVKKDKAKKEAPVAPPPALSKANATAAPAAAAPATNNATTASSSNKEGCPNASGSEQYPWDNEVAADIRAEVLNTHSRVQCTLRLLTVVEALCVSNEVTARLASLNLARKVAPLLGVPALPVGSAYPHPSLCTRAFELLSHVMQVVCASDELMAPRAVQLCSALMYVFSTSGVEALETAQRRIDSQAVDAVSGEEEEGSKRSGASLVIIPAGVVALLRDLSTATQSGEQLHQLSSFAFLWPVLGQVLLVQHDGRLPGWKGCYQLLAHFITSALTPQSMQEQEAVAYPLLQDAVRLVLHCAPMAGDVRGVAPPAELLTQLVSVGLLQDVPLGALTSPSGGLFSREKNARGLCLQAVHRALLNLQSQTESESGSGNLEANYPVLRQSLWVLRHDTEPAVAEAAATVWGMWEDCVRVRHEGSECGGVDCAEGSAGHYFTLSSALFENKVATVRKASAAALGAGISTFPSSGTDTATALKALYTSALPEKVDMSLQRNRRAAGGKGRNDDKLLLTRLCVANSIGAIGRQRGEGCTLELVMDLVRFLCGTAVVDPSYSVRASVLDAGKELISAVGELYDASSVLAFFEGELKQTPSATLSDDEKDYRHESLAILLGNTGKYLKSDPDTLTSIVHMLVRELKTPSESVQEAVADCLVPLVQAVKESDLAKDTLELLLTDATSAASYGDRRGAAYGIAAFVKGMGIAIVKNRDIVNRLKVAAEKGTPQSRQGALAAFECLCARLGFLFEPYVIVIFPVLLKCIANSNDLVRDGSKSALAVIMTKLTAHGMRQVLAPVLNELLEESAWKTRAEAVRLLGYIVQCASKQVAPSLPQIVNRVTEAMSDPHPKVKEAAKQAMADVSGSVRNPELGRISGTLVAALSDPANKTKAALEALLQCEFMHSIDAPSLAILVPVLIRAMRDRGADLKRKSAAITGNIVSMVSDPKLLAPHLSNIVPCLQECLIDPIPDVRATAGKAMGNLVGGMGETAELVEVVPWLALTLCSEESPVERSGAAAGLAEVCFSLSESRMAEVVVQTLPLAQSSKMAAREGLLWFVSYLPAAVGETFAPHLAAYVPILIDALNDPVETVREVALRAGQMIARSMVGSHATTLVGYFCEAVFVDSWRIRNGCLELLGEVLNVVAAGGSDGGAGEGTEGGGGGGGEYMWDTRVRMANVSRALGPKMKAKAVAVLYIARTDISNACRQSALKVWKSLTSNTTELAMENMTDIVYEMTAQIGSEHEDIQSNVAKALNDTISKMGDSVLPMVLPEMTAGMSMDNDETAREGMCLGLAEVFNALSKKQYQDYASILLPALEMAICDPSEAVRVHAATAFSKLTKVAGLLPAEQVVTSLVKNIATSSLQASGGLAGTDVSSPARAALRGLQEILKAKPRDVLDFLIPLAVKSPMGLRDALLLETACAAAGPALTHYLSKILHTVVSELKTLAQAEAAGTRSASDAEATRAALHKSVQYTMQAISSSGLDSCLYEIQVELANELSAPNRTHGYWILEQLVRYTDVDEVEEHVSTILKYILGAVGETDKEVLEAAAGALGAVTECYPMDYLMEEIDFTRSVITSTASDARHRADKKHAVDAATGRIRLAFFSQRRAFDSMLALYSHGLSNGEVKIRVSACYGLSEVLVLCDPASLKPYMSKLAGKLINVFGGKFPAQLKEAILMTMCTALEVGGPFIKAFVPQLQSTFIKGIKDEDGATRQQAQAGLALLVSVTPRTDAMLSEIAGVTLGTDSREVQLTALRALDGVISALIKAPNAVASEKIASALKNADEYTPDFDGDDDRETEALIGRAVERCKEAIARLPEAAT